MICNFRFRPTRRLSAFALIVGTFIGLQPLADEARGAVRSAQDPVVVYGGSYWTGPVYRPAPVRRLVTGIYHRLIARPIARIRTPVRYYDWGYYQAHYVHWYDPFCYYHGPYWVYAPAHSTRYSPVVPHRNDVPADRDTEPEEILPQAGAWDPDTAGLHLTVPQNARVFINDNSTTTTGRHRQYVARNLEEGQVYEIDVRVEVERQGERLVANRQATLAPGKTVSLSIDVENETAGMETSSASASPATEVTLNVPAEASVYLAGHATQLAGETRRFETRALAPGERWDDYRVRVEWEADGQTYTAERVLAVEAGGRYELTVEADAIASSTHRLALNTTR